MKRKDKSTIFEVPTSGKILEVNYRAEFDEWWVHCREGETIVVYTYDNRTNSWGKVMFTPKKADDKAKLPLERPTELEKPRIDLDSHPMKEFPEQKQERKDPDKEIKKDKKWWDPFNLIRPEKK